MKQNKKYIITYKSREHYEAEIAEWKDGDELVFLKKIK